MTFIFTQLGTKRLELLRQLIPKASGIAILVNPAFPPTAFEISDVETGARSLGLQTSILKASTEPEIEAAFTSLAPQKVDALIVGTDPFLLGQRDQLVRLAARYAVPTFFTAREFGEAGGLISYGPNITNGYRRIADIAADELLPFHQSENSEGTRPHGSSQYTSARR